jgi:hypothetical protein
VRVADANGTVYSGRGADGDIIVSSTKAYLNALNRMLRAQGGTRRGTDRLCKASSPSFYVKRSVVAESI